jgi:hypothetical protein
VSERVAEKMKDLNPEWSRWLYSHRDSELSLDQILEAGHAMYGDPHAIRLYGRSPLDYFPLGIRLMGRTVIECCIDDRAQFLAEEAYRATHCLFPGERPIVVDLFAGSCNLLFHVARRLNAIVALGFEKDDGVFALTRRNLSVADVPVNIYHGDYAEHLPKLFHHDGAPLVFIVSPPWGQGFNYRVGLDLCRTEPPVNSVIDQIRKVFPQRSHMVMIQTHYKTVSSSVQKVSAGFREVFDSFDSDTDTDSHVGFLSCAHIAP